MLIKTVQQFIVEYEVPEYDKQRFFELLEEGSDEIVDYEVDQVFLTENIVHVG